MGAVLRPIQGAGTRSRHTLAARCGGEVLSDGRSESFGLPDWNALVLEDVTRLARRKWVECVGGKWIYCSRGRVWEVACSLLILVSLDGYSRPIRDCISGCQCRRKRRENTRVRTGVSGRNPLRRLPSERPSEWGDSNCEYWANGAENTRVKDYRILVCVSLLLGKYLSDFLWILGVVRD